MKKAKAQKILNRNNLTFDNLVDMSRFMVMFASDMAERSERIKKLVYRVDNGLATKFVAKEVACLLKENEEDGKRLLRWFDLLPVAFDARQKAKGKEATDSEPNGRDPD